MITTVRLNYFVTCGRGFSITHLTVFPAFNNQKQNKQKESDKKVDNSSHYSPNLYVAFVTLHQLTIVPVLGYATGAHFLTT